MEGPENVLLDTLVANVASITVHVPKLVEGFSP